jgi:hypothetical protein
MIPLDRINSVSIDVKREVNKLASYSGPASLPGRALSDVYRAYKDLKTLRFFGRVYEQFHNAEEPKLADGRTYDIFQAELGRGRIFIITEASAEAANAFHDDGLILLKLREWLEESLRRVVSTDLKLLSPVEKWDRWLYGKGTVLPRDVRAIPFFSQEFVPGVPALAIAFVKPQ